MSPTRRHAAAVAAVLVLALAGCGEESDDDVAASSTSDVGATSAPTSPAPSASPTETSDSAQETGAVAVYYVRDTTNGPRLYREFHQAPTSDEPVRDALEAMLTVPADDPDYTSLWPSGTEVLGVDVDGATATVDLSQEATTGQAGSEFEATSVQQLVHTVTAADPSIEQVQLLVEGEQRDTLWGAADVSGPVARAPQAEVLGPVWVLTPTEGGTVAAGGEVGGVATVFEATVNWQWLQGDRVVAEGFSTTSEGAPSRGDWTAPVDVPPGDYVFKAFESSARDGSETFVDTKSVTVTG